MRREKTGETGENLLSKARTSNTLNPHTASGRNRTQATLEGGEHTFRCAIPSPLVCYVVNLSRNNEERQQVDLAYVAKTAAKKPEILENILSFVLLCYLYSEIDTTSLRLKLQFFCNVVFLFVFLLIFSWVCARFNFLIQQLWMLFS